ncbi:MAG: hypothetical protein ACI4HO_02320, partial [Ruminococcus sp.]
LQFSSNIKTDSTKCTIGFLVEMRSCFIYDNTQISPPVSTLLGKVSSTHLGKNSPPDCFLNPRLQFSSNIKTDSTKCTIGFSGGDEEN